MVRIAELLALMAPVAGVWLLVAYRRRSPAAFGWGLAACGLWLAAAAITLWGTRSAIVAVVRDDASVVDALQSVGPWEAARVTLLAAAAVLLVVAALVDRSGKRPVGWLMGGAMIVVLGAALGGAEIDMSASSHRWERILGVLVQAVAPGVLAAGLLVLCFAVMVHRGGDDGRTEPAELARRAGSAAWRMYTSSRGGPDR